MNKKQGQKIVKCSFCGREGHEVGGMIAGPDVYICDICISSSIDILKNNLAAYQNSNHKEKYLHTPELIKKQLDEYVIGQERAKKVLERGAADGAPVVFEDHPNYQNLIGRVEHMPKLGALVTDFTLIKAGALHRANGGYLLLDAHKVLMQPYAWEGLKRALITRRIRIDSLGQIYSLVSTLSLEPEAIPLDLKIVLFGERIWDYLLSAYDPDFGELFRVAADFEDEVPRTTDNQQLVARLAAPIARRNALLPLDRGGVARVIEQRARDVEDSERLSTHMQRLVDLLTEADFLAHRAGAAVIGGEHVAAAVVAQRHRAGRVSEQMQQAILRGTVLIDTSGTKVGQINGLSVYALGDQMFAKPTRIIANVRIGEGEVIDVQREVQLGGPIHLSRL